MSHRPERRFDIDGRAVGSGSAAYFIADIAANHDGSLERAKEMICLAAEAGADAAKFQHFKAKTIVSDMGFRSLGGGKSHQAKWGKSVYEVYEAAAVDLEWTAELAKTCKAAGISFFTSPYALDLVDAVDSHVPAYKIGSGDITWHEIIGHIASKGKPVILATGASTMDEVGRALDVILRTTGKVALLQCNTNYTASLENFKFVKLRVLQSFREIDADLVLGLSDHTPGHATVLGAIALGAKVIEKHFTDDTTRNGPDHAFSMDPRTWRDMVDRSRELEYALGDGRKSVEENERETVILQRRAIRLRKNASKGDVLSTDLVEMLRPCPTDALPPYEMDRIVGMRLRRDIAAGEHLRWIDLE
jgi:sialic acid synthase SpsE